MDCINNCTRMLKHLVWILDHSVASKITVNPITKKEHCQYVWQFSGVPQQQIKQHARLNMLKQLRAGH